jgi:hypothetical protein
MMARRPHSKTDRRPPPGESRGCSRHRRGVPGGAWRILRDTLAGLRSAEAVFAIHPSDPMRTDVLAVIRDAIEEIEGIMWAGPLGGRSTGPTLADGASVVGPSLPRWPGCGSAQRASGMALIESAPVHYWMTSFARASIDGGIVRPISRAVRRLRSNLILS